MAETGPEADPRLELSPRRRAGKDEFEDSPQGGSERRRRAVPTTTFPNSTTGQGPRFRPPLEEDLDSESESLPPSDRRRNAGSGPNLRGSRRHGGGGEAGGGNGGPRWDEDDFRRVVVEKEPDPRLTLSDLPDQLAKYPSWRYKSLSAILASGVRVEDGKHYVEQIETALDTDLGPIGSETESVRILDQKLFDGILKSMKISTG